MYMLASLAKKKKKSIQKPFSGGHSPNQVRSVVGWVPLKGAR